MTRKNTWALLVLAAALSLPLTGRELRVENIAGVKGYGNSNSGRGLERANRFLFTSSQKGGWSMKTFEVQFRYRDRNEETAESMVKLEASSLPGAVGKATREFVKGLDRKQRFDMNKNGLEIVAKPISATTEAEATRQAAAS